jgi:serine-type D-Ala-D-Ala carboxypeptidase/endopeptidase
MKQDVGIVVGFMMAAIASQADAKPVCRWDGDSLPGPVAAAQQKSVESYLADRAVTDLVVTIVEGGRTTYLLCAASGTPRVTPATRFEVGSLSKVFTGLLLAQAVTDKRVQLDDDVRTFLPDGYDGLAFDGKPVTLRHLSNMTSGLPDDLPARTQPAVTAQEIWRRYAVLEAYGRDAFFRDLKASRIGAEPGQNPSHSNVASILLGYILEDIYGTAYRDLVAKTVEAPAGMTGSAQSEAKSVNAQGEAMPRLSEVEYAVAAGGLSYTPRDLAQFMRYLTSNTSAAVDLSLRPTWKTLDGEAAVTLGWIWRRSGAAGPHFQTSGGTYAFASYTDIYKACRIGLSFVQNGTDDESQKQLAGLADGFAAALVKHSGRVCESSK